MSIEHQINIELIRLKLSPLAAEQIQCLHDPARLEEAAGMLADLRDRCGVRLPVPDGADLGGPCFLEDEAVDMARRGSSGFPVVTVDRAASDASRSTGVGDKYYVTGYGGADAAVALAALEQWVAIWVQGDERTPQL